MATYQRGETYFHYIELRNRSSQLTDADTVVISIFDPCETEVINDDTLNHRDTGKYSYSDYTIPDDAVFGRYNVEVDATCGAEVSTFTESFWVLPWDMVDDIRALTGMSLKKIDDDQLTYIAWNAYIDVRARVFEYQYREKLCCCTNGTCACCGDIECDCNCGTGSPTTCDSYRIKHYPIADFNTDSHVYGCNCTITDCRYDLCCIWRDSDGVCHTGAVEVVNADCGEIKVYQDDCVTAIPANNEGIYISYFSAYKTYRLELFKKVVSYLAAYELAIRFNLVSEKVSGCDERARVSFADRLWDKYIDTLEMISRPQIEGAD